MSILIGNYPCSSGFILSKAISEAVRDEEHEASPCKLYGLTAQRESEAVVSSEYIELICEVEITSGRGAGCGFKIKGCVAITDSVSYPQTVTGRRT
jgi:hypothetical protein